MTEPLLPNQPIQFHFFEPRYRLMAERMLAHMKYFPKEMILFGYVNTYKPEEGTIGTLVHIHQVKPLPTGTYLMMGTGYKKFRITEHWIEQDTGNLHKASVEIIEDEDINDITQLMEDAYRKLITQTEAAHQRMTTTTTASFLSSSSSPGNYTRESGNATNTFAGALPTVSHTLTSSRTISHDISMEQEQENNQNNNPQHVSSSFIHDLPMDHTAASSSSSSVFTHTISTSSSAISETVKSFPFTPTELATVASDILFQNTDLLDRAQEEYQSIAQNITDIATFTKTLFAVPSNSVTMNSTTKSSSSSTVSVKSLQKLYVLHKGLCTLRAYAIARVMAQHIQLTVSTGANYAQFLKQYGSSPTTFNPVDGGKQIHQLSNWLTSIVSLPSEQRIQLLNLSSTYARLWGCIIALWDNHGFGSLNLETIYSYIHHGQNSAEVQVALTNAENAVFSLNDSSPTNNSSCRMRTMWSWLQSSLGNDNSSSSSLSSSNTGNSSALASNTGTANYGSSASSALSSSALLSSTGSVTEEQSTAPTTFSLYQHQFNDILMEMDNYGRSSAAISNLKHGYTEAEDPPVNGPGNTTSSDHRNGQQTNTDDNMDI